MRKINAICPATTVPSPSSQYADNTTLHCNERHDVEQLVNRCEPIFTEDNLQLNKNKTQYLTVTKSDSSWKDVKLLGSLLGSAEDVEARIRAANRAFGTISWRYHTLTSRPNIFTVLILPVLLYSCGLWTMTCQLGNKLDVWHRRKLRYLLGIASIDHVANSSIYERTNQIPVTITCRTRRLLWLGHVIREGPGSPHMMFSRCLLTSAMSKSLEEDPSNVGLMLSRQTYNVEATKSLSVSLLLTKPIG